MSLHKIPKVLIIDDQESNRLLIRLTLQNVGEYIFFEAQDGEEGIKLAIKESPHIILIDALMPKIDGFEAIKILRNTPNTMDIPILMVSSLDSKDQKVQVLQSGMSDFISKPYDKSALITRVNSLLHLYMMFLKTKKKLKNSNKKLEEKVNKAVEQKLEDVKLASIGKMTAGITHELNTPITYMKSNLELMGYDIEDIQNNESLKVSLLETHQVLVDGLNRIKNIVDNTREISKKGKNSFQKENIYSTLIYCSRMIYNRAKHLTPIYINNRLFDLDIDQNLEKYTQTVIKERIEQVWIIILNNACDEFETSTKEFNERKMLIEISKVNGKIVVKFKDNANSGIPEDIIENIFDPFISTKIDKGMGVGLNIAKDIVEEHYGTIKAYNEDNCAVFEVVI
ncbi:MAG: hybrid sensor histidine kinase/response regulator [Arcobacteraceae bacterium]